MHHGRMTRLLSGPMLWLSITHGAVCSIGPHHVRAQSSEKEHATGLSGDRDFTWHQTETSVALLNHGRVVWQHDHDRKVGKPYMRVGLLDGTELTRPWPFPADYPKRDHTWHRALWWSGVLIHAGPAAADEFDLAWKEFAESE